MASGIGETVVRDKGRLTAPDDPAVRAVGKKSRGPSRPGSPSQVVPTAEVSLSRAETLDFPVGARYDSETSYTNSHTH